jgi:hypothetical protein
MADVAEGMPGAGGGEQVGAEESSGKWPARRGARLFAVLCSMLRCLTDGLFAVLLFVSCFHLPCGVGGADLESSWAQALPYLLKSGAQSGRDYIFTFGPLGLVLNGAYDADTFWFVYGWEVAAGAAIAGIAVALGRRIKLPDVRILYQVTVLLLLSHPLLQDMRYVFATLALSVLLLVSRPRVPAYLFAGLFFAAVSVIKFTFALLAGPAIVLVAAWKWREAGHRWGVLLPAAYGVCLAGVWLALGQSLWNLPPFVLRSLELSSGYVEAMSQTGSPLTLKVGLLVASLGVLSCLGVFLSAERKTRYAVGLLLALLTLYVEFRHGFVRHDLHAIYFFAFCPILPFVIVATEARAARVWGVRLGFGLSMLLSLIGLHWVLRDYPLLPSDPVGYLKDARLRCKSRVHLLRHPQELRDGLDVVRQQMAEEWALPRIRKIVGDRSIDTVSGAQGVVILNGFNYRPRPIMTSYAAYTPRLLELNADYYRGEDRPQFVLLNLVAVDTRFPASEDSAVLLELLRNYRPVTSEKGFLLLQRSETPVAAPAPLSSAESTFFLGQEIELPDEPDLFQTASFHFRLHGSGKLLHSWFRNPILYLNARLNTGEQRRFRLVPGLVEHEFLFNPVLESNGDFLNLGTGKDNKRIVALSITQEKFHGLHPYSPVVRMTLKTYPRSLVRQLSPAEKDAMEWSAMGTVPTRIKAMGMNQRVCDGVEALVVVGGTAFYDVPPGRRRVSGLHGVWAAAYDPALRTDALRTDGMEFAVEFVSPAGVRSVLFRKRLDPVNNPADRGPIPFAVELPPGQDGGTLELRTFDEAPHNWNLDWGYWSQIKID